MKPTGAARLFAIIVSLAAAGCAAAPSRTGVETQVPASRISLRVQVAESGNAVRRVDLEDYVLTAVISELALPGAAPDVQRMMEVQSVVVRTYALANRNRHGRDGFDLCSTTHCQLFQPSRITTSRAVPAAAEAVRRSAGEVVWHDGAPAVAMFHADCGGHTSTSVDAWGGTSRPYLKAARDDGPAESAHARWTYPIAIASLLNALNADSRTRVGSRLDTIRIVDRDPSGRAATVALHGAQERLVRGEDLRSILTRQFGARAIRSTLFDVRRDGMSFVFDGKGFGHGVGLCQAGALARIRAGATAAEVLRHYYPGTTLHSAN